MKQKRINDILYVFDVTPYVITNDTDAEVIKVQQECYEGYVELNPDLAEKIVKYNYHMITVTQQEWAPYVDAAGSVLQVSGQDWLDNVYIKINDEVVVNQSYYELNQGDIIEIVPVNDQPTTDYWVTINGTAEAPQDGKWTMTMGEDLIDVWITYHQPVTMTLNTTNISDANLIIRDGEGNNLGIQSTYSLSMTGGYGVVNFWPRANYELYQATATDGVNTWELVFGGEYWGVNIWDLAPEIDALTVSVQYDSNIVEITGTDILDWITVKFDDVEQVPNEWYYDVPENTVIDIYPTENAEDYELISGATWDTDHWTATCDGSDLTITINCTLGPGPQPVQKYLFQYADVNAAANSNVVWGGTIQEYTPEEFGEGIEVDDGTVIEIYPKGDPQDYHVIWGATWDDTHWVATVNGADLSVFIQYLPQPTGYNVYLSGTDIHQHSNIYFDNVQQQMDIQWTNVADGTVITLVPTQYPGDYTLNSGATWDASNNCWTATVNGADVSINVSYEVKSGVTVTYDINDETQEVQLFHGGGGSSGESGESEGESNEGGSSNVPDEMWVDGVQETVASTWRFTTSGTHTVQYIFNDHCFDIIVGHKPGEPSNTDNYVTSVTVGSDITAVDGECWAPVDYDPVTQDDAYLDMTYLAIVPPTITGNASTLFGNVYVPADSVTAYQTATTWSDYSSLIQAIQ